MNTLDYMLFVDVETTGIELDKGHLLLEVGMAVTDRDFEIMDTYQLVLPYTGGEIRLSAMNSEDSGEWVIKTHTENGLIAACADASLHYNPQAEFGEFISSWFGKTLKPTERPPMCGSSVSFDRGFLKKWMPTVEALFSYRNIDVSTIKELCKRLNPELYAKLPDSKRDQHRVMPDLEDTIAEMKWYADNFLFQNWS